MAGQAVSVGRLRALWRLTAGGCPVTDRCAGGRRLGGLDPSAARAAAAWASPPPGARELFGVWQLLERQRLETSGSDGIQALPFHPPHHLVERVEISLKAWPE